MSLFLISFPNQIASPACSLIAFDILQQRAYWVRFENYIPTIGEGVSGVCHGPDFVAICTQSLSPYIIFLHPVKLQAIHAQPLKEVRDPHSITYFNGDLYVVSTGTNAIYRLKVEDFRIHKEELFWRYPGYQSDSDEVHLNGITIYENRFIASAFGPKKDGKWGSYGKVFYPETGEVISEGLQQPHSPKCSDGSLFFAESSTGQVHIYKRGKIEKWIHAGSIRTGGYPRGIAFHNKKLYIGISSSRNVSKSQGIMLGEQQLGSNACLMCFNLADLSIESVLDISAFSREIYDILPFKSDIILDSFIGVLIDRVKELQNAGERSVDQIGRLNAFLNEACQNQKQLLSENRMLESARHNIEIEKQQLKLEKQQIEIEKQRLMVEKERLSVELSALLQSRSWRLTAPIRLLNKKCKQFFSNILSY